MSKSQHPYDLVQEYILGHVTKGCNALKNASDMDEEIECIERLQATKDALINLRNLLKRGVQ